MNKWKDRGRKKSAALLSDVPEPAVEDGVPLIDEAEYRAVLAARAANLIESDFNTATWQAFWWGSGSRARSDCANLPPHRE